MSAPLLIEPWQLGLALVFVLMAGGASLWLRLGLGREVLVGTLRTFAQLYLMGYVLTHIFRTSHPVLTLLAFAGMVFFASRIVAARVKKQAVPVFWSTLAAMLPSYLTVTIVVTGLVVGVQPWWEPRYFLPLGGMVVGNSMNAMALAMERLFAEVRNRISEVELMLILGAEPKEATRSISAAAVRAGMIPSLNSMMGVGLVFIPGMMTGQILAGADPLVAINYQIVVMLMLVGSATLGSVAVVLLARRKLFNPRAQLIWPGPEASVHYNER